MRKLNDFELDMFEENTFSLVNVNLDEVSFSATPIAQGGIDDAIASLSRVVEMAYHTPNFFDDTDPVVEVGYGPKIDDPDSTTLSCCSCAICADSTKDSAADIAGIGGGITESGTGNNATTTLASGDQYIDGILIGGHWTDATINYSFSLSGAAYDYAGTGLEALPATFSALNAAQEGVVHFALSDSDGLAVAAGFSVEGFTAVDFQNLGNADTTAHLRFGNTDAVGTARVGDFPGSLITPQLDDDGDVWLGTGQGGILLTPTTGTYGWTTVLHEIGHALGLKHSQDAGYSFGATPADMDAMEFTVMSYRSYVGGPSSGGYTNEQFGYAQTFMMLDIAALQYIYGVDYTTNSGDTVYSWDPSSGDTLIDGVVAINPGANRIFATIWDGDGEDTYDLSAYTTDLQINLAPGKSSLFSQAQRANLGGSNFAQGNIYNAMLYQGNSQSLIENAIGGSGNDLIEGNEANNNLDGGAGIDTVSYSGDSGGVVISLLLDIGFGSEAGLDTVTSFENVIGGSGNDLIFGDSGDNVIEGGAGNDAMFGGFGNDTVSFASDAGGVTVSLQPGRANGVDSGSDILSGFENVIGGSGDDDISGSNRANDLWGNDGDDVIDGRNGGDTIYGGLGHDELDGGNGHDTIYGDDQMDPVLASIGFGSGQIVRPADAGNNTRATSIDISGAFSHAPDADIGNAETIPHVSVIGTSDAAGREFHVYALTLENPGTNLIVDLDYSGGIDASGFPYDTYLLLVSEAGFIIASNDDGPGLDSGTTSIRDSYMTYTSDAPGTVYIYVAQWDYTDFSGFLALDPGLSYELQVSVEEPLTILGNDIINGGNGRDTLFGEHGDDVMDGGNGHDTIDGGLGDDTIDGGNGRDTINGGEGNDILEGGNGRDYFIFGEDFGLDTIEDFGRGPDKIDFSDFAGFNSFADVLAAATQVGSDVEIYFDADNVILLEDFDIDDLGANDFIF